MHLRLAAYSCHEVDPIFLGSPPDQSWGLGFVSVEGNSLRGTIVTSDEKLSAPDVDDRQFEAAPQVFLLQRLIRPNDA